MRARYALLAVALAALLVPGAAIASGGGANPDHVTVMAGGDRYETAAELALSIYDEPGTGPETLYIANGQTGVDALALGGNFAPDEMRSLLFVTRDEVPSATADALRRLSHSELVFLGGEEAISASVREQVAALTDNYAYPN